MIPRGPVPSGAKIISWNTMKDVASRFIATAAPAEARSLMVLKSVDEAFSEGTLRLSFSAVRAVNGFNVRLPLYMNLGVGIDNGLISTAEISNRSSLRHALSRCPTSKLIAQAVAAGTAAIQLSPAEVAPVRNVLWDWKTARWQLSVVPSKSWLQGNRPPRWAIVYLDGKRVVEVMPKSLPKGTDANTLQDCRTWLDKAGTPEESPSAAAIRLLKLAASKARR